MAKKRNRFTAQQKLEIVLEGMRGDITIAAVCRKYGIYHSDYERWRRKVLEGALVGLKENGSKTDPEKEALVKEKERLEKALLDLTIENQLLKKKRDLGFLGPIKSKWVSPEIQEALIQIIEQSEWPVTKTCRVLGINPTRYYRWKKRLSEGRPVAGKKPLRLHSLLPEEREAIIEYALKNPDIRHRKLAYYLRREKKVAVSPSTVYRVLKSRGLIAGYRPPKKPLKKREIKALKPNTVWRIDITYIPLRHGHSYLISVLDSYSRFIVHAELCDSMTTRDVKKVIDGALAKENLICAENKPVLVSDNGVQLTSKSFKKFLKDLGIRHIRTAYRHPESNGLIEVFHKIVKYEHVYVQDTYKSLTEAKEDILKFVEYYNQERLHEGIGFVTPYERHTGRDLAIKEEYRQLLEQARRRRLVLNSMGYKEDDTFQAA